MPDSPAQTDPTLAGDDAGATEPGVTLRRSRFADLTPGLLYDLLRLRVDVFVVEQECPYPELDGRDTEPTTQHLWVDVDGDVAATIRVLQGTAEDPGCYAIGRVCTATGHRGAGHAAALMVEALRVLGDGARVRLGAQAHLQAWYERFGFVRSGPDYDEDGILHLPMVREGAPAGATR